MDIIKTVREKYKTAADLCREIGISEQFWHQIKKKERRIPPKTAYAIHRIHGIPLHEIRPDIFPEY